MSNRPTANQISLGASTNLDQVINPSGQWIGSATGLQGPQGTNGAQGVQGLQGLQGRQGLQGSNGIQGDIGIQGQIGQNGIQGSVGIQGVQGVQGLQGRQGATGTSIQGTTGAQGTIGTSIQGATGAQGTIGTSIQGTTGAQGVQGLQGLQGRQGVQGLQGRQGVAGGFTTSSNAQVNSLGVNTAASGMAGEIRATNEITAFYSDMRLKTFLGEIQEALAKIESIQGFYFHPNDLAQALGYANTRHVGLSAQEIAEILPEIIRKAPIDEEYMTLDYSKMVPLLVQAIKELNAKYDDVMKRLERLENDAS